MPELKSALVKAMQQADFYPHAVDHINMLQTHAAWIFLTGDFAYKLKKPVNFGFLDFSNLAKRQYFCNEELRLNRRLAADLYLEVLPISEDSDGRFRLESQENIRDYCLKMIQFSQSDLLGERLQKDRFNPAWMDALAASIASFHAQSGASAAACRYGQKDILQQHIDASLEVAARYAGHIIDESTLQTLRQRSKEQIEQHTALFAERIAAGRIRDCHGDLHLGNIALFDGQPLIFDCIEFNAEYRIIDTLNDAAFLIMDCQARDHSELAFRFLSRYLEHSGDYAGMPLLPLFLAYRAGVRGKVACLLAEDSGIEEDKRINKLDEAAHYFTLAGESLKNKTPRLFVIGGLSGSGKSHLALKGCGIEGAIIIRSDATRKRIAKKYPDAPLYGEKMTERTYQSMFKAAKLLLEAGFPVMLDATFLHREFRMQARQIAARENVKYSLLWLDVPEETLRRNITRRCASGTDVSDADLNILEHQLAAYQRPQEDGVRYLLNADSWPDIHAD
ncbi:MAG: AAA family ATPase [Mariprofundaceae bacterium]|nr:AAA family ATPase [Mariprofundaceae bacterium]